MFVYLELQFSVGSSAKADLPEKRPDVHHSKDGMSEFIIQIL